MIDVLWRDCELRLPKGWSGLALSRRPMYRSPGDPVHIGYQAQAFSNVGEGDRVLNGWGDTPEAALGALNEALATLADGKREG